MKQFTKWLVEMDDQSNDGTPPVNGGVTPPVPPEVASELSAIAQKINALLKKLGIDKNDEADNDSPNPEKGLGDKSMGDKGMGSAVPGPPPNFQN
jgi:hypothetical protein